jgi:hypothetical protein
MLAGIADRSREHQKRRPIAPIESSAVATGSFSPEEIEPVKIRPILCAG